ncbi:MAG: site-specific integrase [Oscillatoriales cyanobacterium C42_A2020_001]|nr:site-specific integrase [Leptolyngbyaceae cyanobacterium C42_A2020_001]
MAQANGRLKNDHVGVAIEVKGAKLLLRAVFPPKPGSSKDSDHQQRLFIGYSANPAGLKLAEKEARKIGGLLQAGEFDWKPYIKEKAASSTVGEWVEQFERDYFTRRQRNPKTETTWKDDYLKVFKRLPAETPLTIALMREAIANTEPDTRTRKRYVDVLSRLAEFAGLQVDFTSLKGNYSPKKVQPRDLPTDEVIAEWWGRIPNSAWRRAYGLIVTYGLRPHELFHLSFEALPELRVLDSTKTGYRPVYPFYPEWFERWDLTEGDLPQVTGRNNTDLGNRVTHAFARYNVPFCPYDTRHAWAVRTIHFGLPDTLAAKQMGHSVQVHTELYHAWLSANEHRRMWEVLVNRSDRPNAPST